MQPILRFLRHHRIPLTLAVVLSFILATPFSTTMLASLPWSVVALCLAAAAYAWWVRDRTDALLATGIAAIFVVGRLYFNAVDGQTFTLRATALLAYLLLHVVLLIGPWSRFSVRVREWYKHRRHLGVTSFLLALLHSNLIITLYFKGDILGSWRVEFIFFGSTALLVMAVLAVTSWDWFQKHVPWKTWAIVHAAFFVVYLIEIWIATGIWKKTGDVSSWTYPAFAAFIVYWVIVAPWGFAPRLFKVLNGWKQLHVLVYVAYVSAVLHLYFGAALAQDPWAQWTVIGLFVLVMGSHAAGWIRNAQERRSRSPVAGGASNGWTNVCALSDLKPGEGRRVDMNGFPIALFLHEGRVLAFFGYCAHQKGPLWQGKIIQGYLTCPWHGWQYSVKDGKGPEGLHDQVPFYETKVEGGRVFVRIEKGKECKGYGCGACRCHA
ncbi:MAG TPA: Rieske 2Fe-2S domain-containing protein [Candidatus Methylomirabilis sp.]|nr:Rieske 2Fe-2S domain-containing protein [Candidatus Methylomirabilis sp.]